MKKLIFAILIVNFWPMLFPDLGFDNYGPHVSCVDGDIVKIPEGLDFEGRNILCENIPEFNDLLDYAMVDAEKLLIK
jgi:hypothetical protein